MGEIRIGMGCWRDCLVERISLTSYSSRSVSTETGEEFGGFRRSGFGPGSRQPIGAKGCLASAAVDAEEVLQLCRGRSVSARSIRVCWLP